MPIKASWNDFQLNRVALPWRQRGGPSMKPMIAVAPVVLSLAVSAAAVALEPIIYEGDNPTIRLEVLGTHRGDAYNSSSSNEPAAYDPIRKRLFVVSKDRGGVDVIDISDPSTPELDDPIDVSDLYLGPEGVLFIPRSLSPIRAPLLVMTHEISDTTTILKIDRIR
jgi:hypothetical protein